MQAKMCIRDRMESLRLGRDVFIPFLEQNTELTPEDEKFLAEIMATESDMMNTGKVENAAGRMMPVSVSSRFSRSSTR